jgi:acyl CoA:acetate/3-ketoacid CoA transferase alpha subunit
MKTISVEDATAMIPNGASLMIGGFMGVGSPQRLIDELVRQGKRNLVVIANDTAVPGSGIGKLVGAGLVSKTIASRAASSRHVWIWLALGCADRPRTKGRKTRTGRLG